MDAGSNAVFSIVGHINGWHFADCSFAGNGQPRFLLTGALHEDGFADTCDGLGGGWKRRRATADNERIPGLELMEHLV